MKQVIGALLALTALGAFGAGTFAASTANAADLGGMERYRRVRAEPYSRPTFRWGGFYFGINAGYGLQQTDEVDLSTDSTTLTNLGDATQFSRGTIGELEADGWFGGAQAGYNFQRGQFVFGIETDIQVADLDDTRSGRFSNPFGTWATNGDASFNLEWFGTVRGRLGWAIGHSLLYATAGFAYGQIDYKLHAFEVGAGSLYQAALRSNEVETGYVVGGGIEHGFTPSWTMKLEYQFIDLGQVRARAPVTSLATGAATGETASTSIDASFHSVRVGLNYLLP